MPLYKNDEKWIFGYGSLIWKPGFSYVEQRKGYIRGWSRRFYQGSTDHRGVPGSPGRVATLLNDPQAICWGIAYRIEEKNLDSIFSYLDYREKGGFSRYLLDFHESDDCEVSCRVYVYVADPDNPEYLGPAGDTEIARQIHRSTGPSGPNIEYLMRLSEKLRSIGVMDEHVFELERQVRMLDDA
ncbi:MAG: gamma-glutamylcyclotransferase [SAR324 cluster bacterium]|nr:gamma-glutamylcyclotransferase [SAR324 cluster bacterium]